MLQLRPNCECGNRDLPPGSPDALISGANAVVYFRSRPVRVGACGERLEEGVEHVR